jgi:hypothetical protein
VLISEEDAEVSPFCQPGRSRNTGRAYFPARGIPGNTAASPGGVQAGARHRALTEDPHIWALALWDQVLRLAYTGATSRTRFTSDAASRRNRRSM